mgnify:FL=1
MRIGNGFDIHRFSDDDQRPLWLGLTHIPGARGLHGHSDADAVTHAVIDALLGATGQGDIGQHFPDSDPAISGISSRAMLEHVLAIVRNLGFRIVNVDVTVVAEAPRLAPYRDEICRTMSEAVGAPVSLKATTMEGLGPIGAREALAALAVCLVEEIS